jgi:hypothetical protein
VRAGRGRCGGRPTAAGTTGPAPRRGAGRRVEHHPGHGDWIRELRRAGFVVEALHELLADEDADLPEYYDIVTDDWARRWPAEDLWVALQHPDRWRRWSG